MSKTFLGVLLLGAVAWSSAAWFSPQADSGRHDPAESAVVSAREHAGRAALDCGRARSTRPEPLDTCMADALLARRPFIGILDEQGVDSAVGRVYAGGASGDVVQYHYDSDPSGGGHAAPTVTTFRCVDPRVEGVGATRRIHCADDGRDLREDVLSPAGVYK